MLRRIWGISVCSPIAGMAWHIKYMLNFKEYALFLAFKEKVFRMTWGNYGISMFVQTCLFSASLTEPY